MKSFHLSLAVASVVLLLASCADDVTNAGANIQPEQDGITLNVDTFHLQTENVFVDYIYSRPDSFLLGTFYDDTYGMTHGDIIAQVACSEGYEFPEGAVADSIFVYLYYQTWFGDGNSPMQINIYEVNEQGLDYSTAYPSNISAATFCDKSELLGSRIVTAATPTDSVYSSTAGLYSPYVSFRLSADLLNRFLPNNNDVYASQTNFTDFFKGMYITTEFGTACMLHVTQIDLAFYYHFTYQINGVDTTVVGSKIYPANSEVRQLNLFEHADRETVVVENDSINYIASPANMFTRVTVPFKHMCQTMKGMAGNKRIYTNSTYLQVDIVNYSADNWVQPWNYLLLIKESSTDRFFTKNELPTDTCALLGTMGYTTLSDGTYSYYYSYDLSELLTQELRKESTDETMIDELNMVLVPVSVTTTTSTSTSGTSSTSVTAVKHEYRMGGATIRSGQNENSPMRIITVYSGF